MKPKRETNQVLMAHWMQAWTTLGRWQALNSRLSQQAAAGLRLGEALGRQLQVARRSRGRFDGEMSQ